ncbi:hypothetical protein BGZ93_000906 [Podila epicladia]|nr:hypothetical protein BGZ93_000906 [Podila epicladia]
MTDSRYRSTLPKLHLPASNIFGIQPSSSSDHQSDAAVVPESVARPFISAHPSPEFSDSDDERDIHMDLDSQHPLGPLDSYASSVPSYPSTHPPFQKQAGLDKKRLEEHYHEQAQNELALSHHLLLAPIPIPQSHTPRSPPHSPLNGKRGSFSIFNHPSPVNASVAMPVSDPAAVDKLIREHVQGNPLSHTTSNAHFWHLGKLSEFSFSDRFVRSRVFTVQDNNNNSNENNNEINNTIDRVPPMDSDKNCHMVSSLSVATTTSDNKHTAETRVSPSPSTSWRLRLYPHGRGDRRRDSEYVGLYLQQDATEAMAIRRKSDALGMSASLPNTSFASRGSVSSGSRRSISGAVLPLVRRHVTLFIATENGDCIAKQDLVEWFSGSEGGLGFPRMVSRKAVQDAVKADDMDLYDDDELITPELGIVAGVIFHDI